MKVENYKEFKLKDYFKQLNLMRSRIIFRKNVSLIKTIRGNYKSDKRYKSEGLLCPDCLILDPPVSHHDSQEALLELCQGNADLRQGVDLANLEEEADYYISVTTRRIQRFGG